MWGRAWIAAKNAGNAAKRSKSSSSSSPGSLKGLVAAGLGLGGAVVAAGGSNVSACAPINVKEESQLVVKSSLGKLSGMIDTLVARTYVAPFVDHTLLKADATVADVQRLCGEAVRHRFKAVCVNGSNVKAAAAALKGTGVKVCAVVGFPLGASTSQVKAFEAMQAIEDGASEIDMVINIGRVKSNDYDYVLRDISQVVSVCKDTGAVCKVIIETCLLTDEEKIAVSKITALVGADFVKTSTGFSTGGATISDVKLMKQAAEEALSVAPLDPSKVPSVKASGGIKTAQEAEQMLRNGATRIGTSRAAKWCEATTDEPLTGY